MFIATLQGHRQRGLSKLLTKQSIEQARKVRDGVIAIINPQDLGAKYSHIPPSGELKTYPKLCQAIFTSYISQKLGHSLNFTIDLKVPYTEFVYNDKTYADRIGPESPYCELVSIVLY